MAASATINLAAALPQMPKTNFHTPVCLTAPTPTAIKMAARILVLAPVNPIELAPRPANRPVTGTAVDVYAALDLGTNNCRLLVAEPLPRGFRVVDAFFTNHSSGGRAISERPNTRCSHGTCC